MGVDGVVRKDWLRLMYLLDMLFAVLRIGGVGIWIGGA